LYGVYMALSEIILAYSILAGIMSILLLNLTIFFEKNKKKSRILLIWSILFLASCFATSEYTFWIQGYNLFEMTFSSFPLIVYFGIWFAFFIWLFESRGERKIWLILLILLVLIIIIALNCMDCIKF